MSWRIVSVSGVAKLDYKMDYLVVRKQDDTVRIHLSEISTLIIESTAVSLTAYLLCELSKQKINVIFCDEKRLPLGMFMPFYGSHNTSLKIRKQIIWTDSAKSAIWTEIVRAKITGQAEILSFLGKPEADKLRLYLSELQPNDETNREGHAAKVYFNALFGASFSREQKNATNAALDYGYSILLSTFAREVVLNGYMTQIGIFHENMFNEFNLASDFMEPFRPFVDYEILSLPPDTFGGSEKKKLINVLNREVLIDNRVQYMTNAIKIYCKSVLDAINANDILLIKFPTYEL